eukprot:6794661-Pyramimonas_sp.AAC.1
MLASAMLPPPPAPLACQHVDVKGNRVDVKGNRMDVKGNRVDVNKSMFRKKTVRNRSEGNPKRRAQLFPRRRQHPHSSVARLQPY